MRVLHNNYERKSHTMSKVKTSGTALLASVLAFSPLAISTSHAATGGPRDSYISLQSPILDATNTSDAVNNQKMADGWVAKGWFGSGLLFQVSFAPVGSTINLTYNVKNKAGAVLPYTPLNLRINKGYSEAASIVEVDGIKTKGVDRPPFDQANVTRRTDAFGNITFALKNLDLESSGEKEPESFTSPPIFSEDKLDRLHSQMLPEVNSEQADHSVITEFHYYLPKTKIVVPAAKPSILLITPKLDATNSFTNDATGVKQAHAPAGGDLVVVYRVIGDDGKTGVPGTALTLKINDGKSTLAATTDAFGFAAFTVKNSDANPNAKPAKPTSAAPAKSSAFAKIAPELAGTTPVTAEGVEFHYYRGISATAAKSGKNYVVSVTIEGAAGKTAAVSVTGAKKTSVRLSSPRQIVPVKVTPGAKTVSVVIDGKTYTAKVTVK
jgi:hypothetical protein